MPWTRSEVFHAQQNSKQSDKNTKQHQVSQSFPLSAGNHRQGDSLVSAHHYYSTCNLGCLRDPQAFLNGWLAAGLKRLGRSQHSCLPPFRPVLPKRGLAQRPATCNSQTEKLTASPPQFCNVTVMTQGTRSRATPNIAHGERGKQTQQSKSSNRHKCQRIGETQTTPAYMPRKPTNLQMPPLTFVC
eukprot:503312-Amphidinium_carterae.1